MAMPWQLLFLLFVLVRSTDGIYRVENGATASYSYEALVLTATFPETVYATIPCFPPGEATKYSCTGCNSAESVTISATDVSPFVIQVSNFATCNAVVLQAVPNKDRGTVITISAGNFTKTLLWDDPASDLHNLATFSYCCSHIMNMTAGTWNGTIWVTSTFTGQFADTTYDLLMPSDTTLLPIQNYFSLVTVDVTCNGVLLNSTLPAGNPTNVFAYHDPFLGYWVGQLQAVYDWIQLPVLNNSISTILWTTRFPTSGNGKVGAVDFGIGSILDRNGVIESGCSIQYTNLVSSNGNPVTSSGGAYLKDNSTCQYEEYAMLETGFNLVLQTLLGKNAAVSIIDPAITLQFIQFATNIRDSYTWQLCLAESISFLEGTPETLNITDRSCLDPEGSAKWKNNPCCNTALADTLCCTPTLYQDTVLNYQLIQDAPCTSPRCLTQALNVLADYASNGVLDYCSVPRAQAEADPSFSVDPWQYCKVLVQPSYNYCQLSAQCQTVDPLSQCDFAGLVLGPKTCTIPCSTDNPCISGTCNTTMFGDICLNITTSTSSTYNITLFVYCLLEKIDGNFRVLIEQDVRRLETYNPSLTIYDNFAEALTIMACLDNTSNTYPPNSIDFVPDTPEKCAQVKGWCSTIGCSLDVDSLNLCAGACLAQIPYGGGVCVWEYTPHFLVTVSRPAICQLRMRQSGDPAFRVDSGTCAMLGGTFLGPDRFGARPFDNCIKFGDPPYGVTNNVNDCYINECIPYMFPDGVVCHEYCYDPSITLSTACTGTVANATRKWYTWLDYATGTVPMSACLVQGPNINLISCSTAGLKWFPGYDWLPELLNSPEECAAGVCKFTHNIMGYDYNTSTTDCELYSCSNCGYAGALSEPRCQSKQLCETTPFCNANSGCYMSAGVAVLGLDVPQEWTPRGFKGNSPNDLCWLMEVLGLAFFYEGSPPSTMDSCDNWAQVCNLQEPGTTQYGSANMPPGYNTWNSSECAKCGGVTEPYWAWNTGQWEVARIKVDTFWTAYPTILTPRWGPVLDINTWTAYLNRAKASILAKISVNELLCKYGYELEILDKISCACSTSGASTLCQNGLTSVAGLDIGIQNFCEGIATNVVVPNFITFIVADTFNITTPSNVSCIALHQSIVPELQFTYYKDKMVTSLAIYSETKLSEQYQYYIYNHQSPVVVVGQLLTDGRGIYYEYDPVAIDGITFCIDFNSTEDLAEWGLRFPPDTLDIVGAVAPFTNWTRFYLNAPLNSTQLCLPLQSQNYTYFIAAFVANADDVQIQHTWKQEETGLIIFIAVSYTCLLIWVFASLALRLISSCVDGTAVSFPEVGLVLLNTQCTIRVIYFIGVSYGVFEFHTLSVLFTDLPQLLFHGAVILTGIMWNNVADEVGNTTTSDRKIALSYAIMASLFTFYLALSIAYGVLSETTKIITCASTDDEINAITPATAVSLTYKAIFAFYSVCITLVFALQAVSILRILHDSPDASKMKNTLAKFWTASAFSIAGLLIQASISIYCAVGDMPNTTKLALIIASEVVPTSALAFLYQFKSPFTLMSRLATAVVSTPQSSTKTTSNPNKPSSRGK